MAADNRYSLLVAWLKIVLPLIALAILSSLFLLSRQIDPGAALPASDPGLADRLREPRLTEPVFTGVTSDGSAVTVTAVEMRPLPGSLTEGTARTLTVQVETPGGTLATLAAPEGQLDTAAQTLALSGGVTIVTADGYSLTAPDMDASMATSELTATGGVTGESPFGTIRSEVMHVTRNPDRPDTQIVDFIGDVRLLYLPSQ
jgi:lipopolysaccharide export system protein LptC